MISGAIAAMMSTADSQLLVTTSAISEDLYHGLVKKDAPQRHLVAQLPDEQREVFLLRQQGMSFKEIAAIQQCSLNTALGRMHYAVQKLRQLLAEWA